MPWAGPMVHSQLGTLAECATFHQDVRAMRTCLCARATLERSSHRQGFGQAELQSSFLGGSGKLDFSDQQEPADFAM